jgi:hypothetical protein
MKCHMALINDVSVAFSSGSASSKLKQSFEDMIEKCRTGKADLCCPVRWSFRAPQALLQSIAVPGHDYTIEQVPSVIMELSKTLARDR